MASKNSSKPKVLTVLTVSQRIALTTLENQRAVLNNQINLILVEAGLESGKDYSFNAESEVMETPAKIQEK